MSTDDDHETHSEEYLRKQKQMISDQLKPKHSDLILDILYDKRESLAASTARNYARELRYIILKSYDKGYSEDIEDWRSREWISLIKSVKRERDLSDGSVRNTYFAAIMVIKWDGIESKADKDDLNPPSVSHSDIDPDSVLTIDEVMELIESTKRDRDSAIIAIMYEAGLRRTALTQLDVKHYITENFKRIKIPNKEGVKTGQYNQRPLNWSSGYLDSWMKDHPDPENPDAPLFTSIRSQDEGKRLSSHTIYTMLKRLVKTTDIDADKVHPHAFRHARVTHLRKRPDINKSDIETLLGWSDSTPMHSRYSHTTSEEEAKTTARRLGVEIEDDEEEQLFRKCPRCSTEIPSSAGYCPDCGQKITDKKPTWWLLYESVVDEDDPLMKKYGELATNIPYIEYLSIEEIDHIYHVYLQAEMNMYESMPESTMPKYDHVTEFNTEEDADTAMEIIFDKIKPRMVDIHESEVLELKEGSIDLDNIKKIAEEHSE